MCECYWAWALSGGRCLQRTPETAWVLVEDGLRLVIAVIGFIMMVVLSCEPLQSYVLRGARACMLTSALLFIVHYVLHLSEVVGVIEMKHDQQGVRTPSA